MNVYPALYSGGTVARGPSSAGSTGHVLTRQPDGSYEPAAPAGGNPAFTNVSVDLGAAARAGKFTLTGLSGLTVGKPVLMKQGVGPYAGKGTLADECEMDAVEVAASVTSTTEITGYWRSATTVKGSFKFDYLIGA